MKVFYYIVLVTFLFAVFGAWREQHLKAKGGLNGRIVELWWNRPSADRSGVLLRVLIVNTASATVVLDYKSHLELADGRRIDGTNINIQVGTIVGAPGGPGYAYAVVVEKLIYDETTSPIPENGQVGGWIRFEYAMPIEHIHKPSTVLVLEFTDAKGNNYSVKSSAIGSAPQKGGYFPGAGSAPVRMPWPPATPDTKSSQPPSTPSQSP